MFQGAKVVRSKEFQRAKGAKELRVPRSKVFMKLQRAKVTQGAKSSREQRVQIRVPRRKRFQGAKCAEEKSIFCTYLCSNTKHCGLLRDRRELDHYTNIYIYNGALLRSERIEITVNISYCYYFLFFSSSFPKKVSIFP